MAQLQCGECGYDDTFDREEKTWVDNSEKERVSYEEARQRVSKGKTSPLHLTATMWDCDCPGQVKFNWNGTRPDDVDWLQADVDDIIRRR